MLSLNTTAHGIGNILRSKSIVLKICWILFLIISIGYCTYQVTTTILQYSRNEVITSQKIVYESPTKFPAVSFCNINSYNGTHVNNLFDENGQLLKNFTDFKQLEIYLKEKLKQTQQMSMGYFYEETLENTQNKSENITFQDLNSLNSIEYIPKSILKDSLKICKFEGKNCSINDFSYHFDTVYGNCYTFNRGNLNSIKDIAIPGVDDGLSVEFEIKSFVTETNQIFNGGIRVVIYNQSFSPFPEEEGFDTVFEYQNNFALSKTVISRLSYPFNSCVEKINEDSFLKNFNLSFYSQKFCKKSCFQLFVIETCKCFDKRLPRPHNVTRCKSLEDFNCLLKAKDLFYRRNRSIDCFKLCPNECYKVVYNKRIFTTNFISSKFYTNGLAEFFPNFIYDTKSIGINVYFEEMEFNVVEEMPAMTLETLISNIGGSLGLFIGISILSLAELFEIVLNILWTFIKN
ncbi:unnamed protein product [Brachionus calyciflorus]|uniref:Uncharacterized protein n=1 Tax=Brachionus calyciflorus TaxID=104777 RepID=A0A813TZA9_9BILA|nr:unnamed protein product [Brachionus calyciflorus]